MITGQWSTTLILLILVILPILILGILFIVLTDRKERISKLISMIVSKTIISGLISALILGLSLIYFFNFTNPISDSALRKFIDTLFIIPTIIPFIFAYAGGEALAFFVFLLEFLILTMIIRFFISDNWIEKINQQHKNKENES